MRTFTLFLLLFVFMTGCTTTPNDTEMYTADKTVEERDAIGNKHLGQVYRKIVRWTKQAAIIEENVGKIVAIAPTSGINRTVSYFADAPTGDLTLEVVGEKGKAEFVVEGIDSCGWEIACFDKGTLKIGESSLEIHQSGMSLEEFNQPANKIAYVTKQIDWRNKYEKFIPEQSAHGAFREWEKRARIHAANKDLENAIFDMRIATILLDRREKEYGYLKPSGELLSYRKELARYYYCIGQTDKSDKIISEILQIPSLKESDRDFYLMKFDCQNIK